MHIGTFDTFTSCYLGLIEKVYNDPSYTSAPRGQKIKEVIGASFTINNPRSRLPYVVGRKFGLGYLAAELIWYLSGNNSTEWISKYSSFWSNISDDGKTANSAYGARLFQKHEKIAQGRFSQWDYIVNELKHDPDSRRAVMHLRVPDDSIDAKLDVPCTLALQFFIREGLLHQVAIMRSSDVIFGIAYDIPAFTVFQEILANELGVGLGTYTHISNSLHIYERHFEMARKILERDNVTSSLSWSRANREMVLPKQTFQTVREDVIDKIVNFESELKNYQTPEDICSALNDLGLDDAWLDLVKILSAKRVRELGRRKEARELMKTLSSSCYDFYVRNL